MHIHILQAVRPRRLRTNKDTNGGYGTANDFGRGLVARALTVLKGRTMNFPELLPAYVSALLKAQGHTVTYAVNELDPSADLVLIQTSIIHYAEELRWAERIRLEHPRQRVGFAGGMATGNAGLYRERGDFVIRGETENALLNGSIADFDGIVEAGWVADLDRLPFPDWSHLGQAGGRYGFLRLRGGRFLPALSSRGCPMSCGYYCTYPLAQGRRYRARSPENVIEEIDYLQSHFGMSTLMFRDPIFSFDMPRVERICELILQRNLHFNWICETHPRFLNPDLVILMRRAGCTVVKLGIESGNLAVMEKSQRLASDLAYQEQIIRCLEEQRIKVLGFYILGYYDDDRGTVLQTIDYACRLNTFGAQFAVATPYPGTAWYEALDRQADRACLDPDFEHYSQYRLVYRHPHLSFDELEGLKSLAYRRYYLRWAYIHRHYLQFGK